MDTNAATSSCWDPKGPLLSKGKDDWRTPARILDLLGDVQLDPCASPDERHHFAKTNWTLPDGSLDRSWHCRGLVFVNPPYSKLKLWIPKVIEQAIDDVEIQLLIPARTDTLGFQRALRMAQAVCWIKGRLKYLDGDEERYPAPFPSAVLYYGPRSFEFSKTYRKEGAICDRARGWVSWVG